jgi:hypothetical protein
MEGLHNAQQLTSWPKTKYHRIDNFEPEINFNTPGPPFLSKPSGLVVNEESWRSDADLLWSYGTNDF